jgi:type IV pilus assembly protein PilV
MFWLGTIDVSRRSKKRGGNRDAGFSMMEVLVSIFVLSLGVICAAGMQLTALRASKQSSFQTNALQLASEMADRMRANGEQFKEVESNPFFLLDYKADGGQPPAPPKLCYANDCNALELAVFDIYEWKQRLRQLVPGARAKICRDATPWNEEAHSMSWDCSDDVSASASLVIKVGWPQRNFSAKGDAVKTGDFPPSVVLTVEPYVQ